MAKGSSAPDDLLRELLNDLVRIPYIDVSDIPGIDLYMDQVTSFMDEHLQGARRQGDDRVLTKTMINNYAKNKLLPPPVKKKYSREHMLILIFIYYFKGILSLQDIQSLLSPLCERYFRNDQASVTIGQIYQEVIENCIDETKQLRSDIAAFADKASDSFTDADDEDKAFLQYFALICYLSMDVFLKKRAIEDLIDRAKTD